MFAWVSRKTERRTCKHTAMAPSKALHKMKEKRKDVLKSKL